MLLSLIELIIKKIMEQQPMVWNPIYSTNYREGSIYIERVYYDNNYTREYLLKNGTGLKMKKILIDTRKMTKEDHAIVNQGLRNISRVVNDMIDDMRKKTEEVKQDKFKD